MYINYTVEKYGKDYIELYEKNLYKKKNNKCLVCGNDCVNIYCCRKCAGKGLKISKNS